ncbi:MAG: hypothetical protein J7M26_03875 [Armatimonadetes bacterium]|nr:hypothetical protein [Armatimonadota bacterium]
MDDAVEQYATLLSLAPSNPYASERLGKIFYSDTFPQRLLAKQLSLLPVPFAQFTVTDTTGHSVSAAYTVSVLFPAQMKNSGKPVVRMVPPGASDGDRCQFNRVLYVFAARPGTQRLTQRAQIYFPSELLSAEGRDYGPLAASLAGSLARFCVYFNPLASTEKLAAPLQVWLAEAGPAGGETQGSNVYLYQIGSLRPGEEWQRELAHELGHALLPELPGYREPEPTVEGRLGEAWLLSALAWEAEQSTGQPCISSQARQWLDGLWPIGSSELKSVIAEKVVAPVRLWQTEGPYATDVTSAKAARLAVGFLLWVQAAHGTAALRQVITTTDLGTLPSLYGAYMAWLEAQEGHINLAALCGWTGYGFGESWLPFGQEEVEASQAAPWRTRCYLPAGGWSVVTDRGDKLLARWTPVRAGEGVASAWGPHVSSRGGWGTLEVAGSGAKPAVFNSLHLRPVPQT